MPGRRGSGTNRARAAGCAGGAARMRGDAHPQRSPSCPGMGSRRPPQAQPAATPLQGDAIRMETLSPPPECPPSPSWPPSPLSWPPCHLAGTLLLLVSPSGCVLWHGDLVCWHVGWSTHTSRGGFFFVSQKFLQVKRFALQPLIMSRDFVSKFPVAGLTAAALGSPCPHQAHPSCGAHTICTCQAPFFSSLPIINGRAESCLLNPRLIFGTDL